MGFESLALIPLNPLLRRQGRWPIFVGILGRVPDLGTGKVLVLVVKVGRVREPTDVAPPKAMTARGMHIRFGVGIFVMVPMVGSPP